MKRLMILTMAMVVLMGISDKAQAGPWTNWAFGRSSYGYGGYGYGYDRNLNRVMAGGNLVLGAYQVATNNQERNRVLTMAEKEQEFRQQQVQQVMQTRSNQEIRARFLEQENQKLKAEIEQLKLKLEKLKLQ